MDGIADGGLRRRHPLRIAGLAAGGLVVAVAVVAAGLYLWLRAYAPLAAESAGFAPGAGIGADIQPVAGSGGRPVLLPAYRRGRPFDVAFTLRNDGRFDVSVDGLAPDPPRAAPGVGPVQLLATSSGTASADPGDELPFQSIRLARGDSAILVLRYRLRCGGSTAPEHDVYSDSVRLRISYLSIFHRTQTVALPFAVTLRCVGGPPAIP